MCVVLNIPIFAYLAYLTAGIYILASCTACLQYNGTATQCESSLLWLYVLISLVLSLLRYNSSGKDVSGCKLALQTLTEFGLAAWGAHALFVTACDSPLHSDLWLFGLLSVNLQVFCGVFTLSLKRMRAASGPSSPAAADATALAPIHLIEQV